MSFKLLGCPAVDQQDAVVAPADVAAFNALEPQVVVRLGKAWANTFCVDAHESLLVQAAPDMATRVFDGRRAIEHHKIEACYARFLKLGDAGELTFSRAASCELLTKVEHMLRGKLTPNQFREPVGEAKFLAFLAKVHVEHSDARITPAVGEFYELHGGDEMPPRTPAAQTWLPCATLKQFVSANPGGDLPIRNSE